MKNIFRSAVYALITVFAGCIAIAFIAPVVKIFATQYQVNEATREMNTGKLDAALGRLLRFRPWSSSFIITADPASCTLIRCLVRLDKTSEAEHEADAIYDGNIGKPVLPQFSPTPSGVMTFLTTGPNWVANKLLLLRNSKTAHRPSSGWEALLSELETAQNIQTLDPLARKFAQKNPSSTYAVGLVTFLDQMRNNRGSKPAKPAIRNGSTGSSGGSSVSVGASPPKTANESMTQTPDRDVEVRRAELKDREKTISASIADRQTKLPALYPPSKEETAYRTALANYRTVEKKARAIEQQANSASGPRRAELLQQAHSVKGELSRCETALTGVMAAGKSAEAKRNHAMANDQELLRMKNDLSNVQFELNSL